MEEDLKCPLCLKILFVPVSTVCGHSYCKACIENCLARFRQCPICRVRLGTQVVLTPAYVLQSIIDKRFPEEVKARKEEEAEKEKARLRSLKPTTLPVVFVKDFISFPGVRFYIQLEEEKYEGLFREMQIGAAFCVVSKIAGDTVAWAASFKDGRAVEGRTVVTALCEARMEPVIVRRREDPQYSVETGQLTDRQVRDSSLYEVPNTLASDLPCDVDKALEAQVLRFAESCIASLTEGESVRVRTLASRHPSLSFFVASVLRLPLATQLALFRLRDENSRLQLLHGFTQGKTPCRLHILNSASSSFPLYSFLGVLLLILISKIFS